MDLPLELRYRIYTEACGTLFRPCLPRKHAPKSLRRRTTPALIAVSRKMRDECLTEITVRGTIEFQGFKSLHDCLLY